MEEWTALRRQVFGAIGRGGRTVADNRLAAAGRCWAALTGDHEARSLLRRVTSSARDPIAQALDAFAAVLDARTEHPGLPVQKATLARNSGLAENGSARAIVTSSGEEWPWQHPDWTGL